jgi:hypothetical protein
MLFKEDVMIEKLLKSCPKCNKINAGNSEYCMHCGYRFTIFDEMTRGFKEKRNDK